MNARIKEIKIPGEIMQQLGFSKVCVVGKVLVIYVSDDNCSIIKAAYYSNDLLKTIKALRDALSSKGSIDDKSIDRFVACFSEVLLKSTTEEYQATQEAAAQKQKENDSILDEIKKTKAAVGEISSDKWVDGLVERYQNLRKLVEENMPELWPGLEFELSILRILNIQGCTLPFIGILLGRPASGKTLIIDLLRKWYCTYYTDAFTAKAFVSHSTAVSSKEELEQIDMLPKIRNKLFLTPELSPTFTAKDEDLNQLLGIITRIADGQGLLSDSGAHGHRGYDEPIMFTWVGAAVDIPYKVYKVLGNLGSKMYFLRMEFKDKTEELLFEQTNEDFNSKIKMIKDALFDLLRWFEIGPNMIIDDKSSSSLPKIKWDDKKDDEQAIRYIIRLAILLSRLRCVAQTWETKDTAGSDYAYSVSQPEDPSRAMTVLSNLARGHALLTGRNYITVEDVLIVVKTVLSTAPIERVILFSLLISNKGKLISSQVTEFLNVSKPTALRTMSELKAVGLVDEEKILVKCNEVKQIVLNQRFEWFLSEEFGRLREGFTPTDNREYLKKERSEDGGGCKEKIPPTSTNNFLLSNEGNSEEEEREKIFWRKFDELERAQEQRQQQYSLNPALTVNVDKDTVNGREFKSSLVSSNKFFVGDAVNMLEKMVKDGKIERVAFDTYRRKK